MQEKRFETIYRAALELARSELESLHGAFAIDTSGDTSPFQIDTSATLTVIDAVLDDDLSQGRFETVRPGVLRRAWFRLRRLFGYRGHIEIRLEMRGGHDAGESGTSES